MNIRHMQLFAKKINHERFENFYGETRKIRVLTKNFICDNASA